MKHRQYPRLLRFEIAPLLLGALLFVVNGAPVLSGYLAPPPGYTGSLLPQSMDHLQYLTWINGYRHTRGWLIPDYNAPWATEPALLNPLCWFIGRTSVLFGLDPLWIYYLVYLALSIAGGYALFFALRAFSGSRTQAGVALLVSFCCVPVASVLALSSYMFGTAAPGLGVILWASKVHGRYTSDGLADGISGSPLVLFGTVSTLLCMGLLAKYLTTNRSAYLRWAGLVAGFSAFVHPFEIFVMVGAGGLALVICKERPWRQAAGDAACLILPGLAGMAPYLYLALRHPWLKEAAVQNRWDAWASFPPPMLVLLLGFPAVFCILSFILPLERRSVTDFLLLLWVGVALVGVYVRWMPWSHHLLDGVHYAIGLLLARQAARSGFMRRLWTARPLLVRSLLGVFLILSLAARAVYLTDAIAAATVAGGSNSTVISTADRAVLAWLREHAGAGQLVLAPRSGSGWFATVPMHSFASHWLFSLTWDEQMRLSEAFYRGTLDLGAAHSLLRDFGVGYAVVPEHSPAERYFSDQAPAVRIESAAIYRISNTGLRPLPPLSPAR